VRPERWLLLSAPATAGAAAAQWQAACAASGAAVDLSSGLAGFFLSGSATREALARGCRLDLDPQLFPPGRAAATIMAQVCATLVALPAGMLLLTPACTARHFHEWLASAAQPFGLKRQADLTLSDICGDTS
jgi:heterotetrameric sarcosine oxidase gamma subunit